MLAIKVLASLACPPMTHKCLEENRHETAFHKSPNLCNSFFEIGKSLISLSGCQKLLPNNSDVKLSFLLFFF